MGPIETMTNRSSSLLIAADQFFAPAIDAADQFFAMLLPLIDSLLVLLLLLVNGSDGTMS